jgi:hypothetical protein
MEKFIPWFELVSKRGRPIERNSGSVRIRLEAALPDLTILKRQASRGSAYIFA